MILNSYKKFVRNIIGLIFFMILLTSKLTGYGQIIRTRLDFVGGIGYPEYLHGGIRYQYMEKGQIGIHYGGDISFKPEIIRTWTLEHMYHFGKNNFYSNRPVWYTRQGYTLSVQTDESYIYHHNYLDCSLGYDFPLNNYVGINIEMGFYTKVYEAQKYKDTEQSLNPDTRWYIGYLARFQVYVSL